MEYKHIEEGIFESRPNRFIAYVTADGAREKVHVKNTGRCRELLVENATVYLERSANPHRSTAYDLVAVRKGERLINMDSQAPNKAVEEWLRGGGLFSDATLVRPEMKYGSSRFDFYVETPREKILIEVKGVTLEQEDVALFPDAPSQRAVKHVRELMEAVKAGYRACVLFVVQMEGVKFFTPNYRTHPAFAEALREAAQAGVEVLAYDCLVSPRSMTVHQPVPVRLSLVETVTCRLLSWYDSGRRILPWRENPTPYHVWVSEIMLQQTRVEAVKPYYDRFMRALPDIASLSGVPEDELLKLWEGLGYYSRARNLKRAAQIIMEEYGGNMPGEYDALLGLPGIGSYTAGAISSIAFGRREPAVDGNVLRVLARLKGDERDISLAGVRREIEKELRALMPGERPGDFNQAMMELGATVCVPSGRPNCPACPLEGYCTAHFEGKELDYPRRTPKKARAVEEKTVLIIRDENRAALQKRPEKGLLAGMYEFPCMEGHRSAQEVLDYLSRQGLSVLRIEPLKSSKHIFTHKEWHMIGYAVRVDELAQNRTPEQMIFVERQKARETYPIPSAYRAYLEYASLS